MERIVQVYLAFSVVCGLVFIGYGGYLWTVFSVNEYYASFILIGSLCCGVALLALVAPLGLVVLGKDAGSKLQIGLYSLLSLVVMALMASVAEAPIGFTFYSNNALGDSRELVGLGNVVSNDYAAALYNLCCVPQGFSNGNQMLLSCSTDSSPLVSPECAAPVSTTTDCKCWIDEGIYSLYTNGQIDAKTCQMFSGIYVSDQGDQIPIVGNSSLGGCGGGSPQEFYNSYHLYWAQYGFPAGITFAVLTGVLLALHVAVLVVACKRTSLAEDQQEGLDEDKMRGMSKV